MPRDKQFLTGVKCYLFTKGNNNDPKGQEGLGVVLENILANGSVDLPGNEFYAQLEGLGASMSIDINAQYSCIEIRAPQENLEKAALLVKELVETPNITADTLEKAVAKTKQDLDDLKSDGRNWAIFSAGRYLVGRSYSFGDDKSLGNISVDSIREVWKEYVKSIVEIEILGPEGISYPKNLKLAFTKDNLEPSEREKARFDFIDKDLGQKVLVLGTPTPKLPTYSYVTRAMAGFLLSSAGLAGLLFEKVREEESAAYYIRAMETIRAEDGALLTYVGTSEDKLEKVVSLILKIYKDVSEGNFSDKRLEECRRVLQTGAVMTYDNLDNLTDYVVDQLVLGKDVKSLKELRQEAEDITKEDLAGFYKDLLKDAKWGITVNGKIDKSLQTKLKEKVL